MGWFLRTSGGECLCAPAVSLWLLLEKAQAAPLGTWNCWNCWKRCPAHGCDTGSCALISAQTNKCLLEAP